MRGSGCWSNVLLLKPTTLTPPPSPPPPAPLLPSFLLPHIDGSARADKKRHVCISPHLIMLLGSGQAQKMSGFTHFNWARCPRRGYGVMLNITDDSICHRSAAVKSPNLPRAASTLCNMILISELRGREFKGWLCEREKEIEIQPAKHSWGKNIDKKNHQNQTASSNSSGDIQGVSYGGEEMALFEGCHVWALWFTVMTWALSSCACSLLRRERRGRRPINTDYKSTLPFCVLLVWWLFSYFHCESIQWLLMG